MPLLDIPEGQREPGIEPDGMADDLWREAVALKRYRFHPMMLIGDKPQCHPSYRDIAEAGLKRSPTARCVSLHPKQLDDANGPIASLDPQTAPVGR